MERILMESPTLNKLHEKFGAAVIDAAGFRGEVTGIVEPAVIIDALRFMKTNLGFNFLVDLCGVDRGDVEPRFEVVYHLLNMTTGERFRIKARIDEEQSLPSVTGLWEAANWMEREAYDMYGILFTGHPNLIRILMFDGFDGFPLRKDFPVKGLEPPEKRYAPDDIRRNED
jgi:NADH-quinone oxidoreductase subunit C